MALIGRILWARWLIVAVTMGFCIIGGLTVIIVSPARYDAKARVTLNYIKPDSITGFAVSSRRVYAYVLSQMQMIQDMQVAAPAVEASGWLENPDLIAAYAARPPGDDRDMTIWAAERILPGIQTNMVQDSNILEIRFRALSPQTAKAIVSALRDAYIDASVRERRTSAFAQAQGLQDQADKVKEEIIKLETEKGAYERKTGVVLQEDGVDLDTLAMKSLAPALSLPKFRYSQNTSALDRNLAQLDGQIATAQAALGLNHPQLLLLKQTRAATAAAAAIQSTASDAQADVSDIQQRNRTQRFESQKAKVVGQREQVLHLRLLQDQINEKRRTFNSSSAAAGQMRQMSTVVQGAATIFGDPVAIGKPAFPNKALILGGAGAFGFLVGIVLAVLIELFNLRVRTLSALRVATGVPVLAELPAIRLARRPRVRQAPSRLHWLFRRLPPAVTQ